MDYSRHPVRLLWGPARVSFPPRSRGGQGGGVSSASSGAGAGEFAVGLVAAFVDAFQAFRDDCLQLRNLLLLFGFSRIHRIASLTCGETWRRRNATDEKLTTRLSETPTE